MQNFGRTNKEYYGIFEIGFFLESIKWLLEDWELILRRISTD